jgi:hypothetical protein
LFVFLFAFSSYLFFHVVLFLFSDSHRASGLKRKSLIDRFGGSVFVFGCSNSIAKSCLLNEPLRDHVQLVQISILIHVVSFLFLLLFSTFFNLSVVDS